MTSRAVTTSRHPRALALFCFLPVLLVSPLLAAQPSEKELKQEELRKLQATIATLRSDIGTVRNRYDEVRAELGNTERAISQISRDLNNTRSALKGAQRKLGQLRREQAALQASVATQRDYLANQIRAAYTTGRQEYLKLLLNQQDPATVGRMLVYYDFLNRARSERIAKLQVDLARLDKLTSEIEAQTQELAGLERQQSKEQAQLTDRYQQREQLMARLKREIRDKDSRLNQLVSDERELHVLINALAEALADIPVAPESHKPFDKLRGLLTWPIRGKLLARYGEQRRSGDNRWSGILISAREGSEVRAVSHGRIAFADWLRGYGMLIIIDHGGGYMSLYGHNQSLYKEVGDWVEKGEVIATVGASGGQDQSGLYFEIRADGKPSDPQRWLSRR